LLGLHDAAELPKHSLIHFRAQGASSAPIHWASWQKLANVPGLDVSAGLVFSDETHAISAVGAQGVALMIRRFWR
jgi:LysR family glycine cleavage system transcriptional activator